VLQTWKSSQEPVLKAQKREVEGLKTKVREAGSSQAALQSRLKLLEGEKLHTETELWQVKAQLQLQRNNTASTPPTGIGGETVGGLEEPSIPGILSV